MIIVIGATGHVGSAVADALLEAGEQIIVVTRDEEKAGRWRSRGAEAAVTDVGDADALRAVFRPARRVFLLNPTADPSTDTDVAERRTMASIVAAIHSSGLEKVVLESTYGAQPGTGIGDLGVLCDFEEALRTQTIPSTILRAAYYMSNWDPLLAAARLGSLPTMLPPDLVMPMVAPEDLGRAAARLLSEPVRQTGIRHVEGPERYTSDDVARAFSSALGRPVDLDLIPRQRWEAAYGDLGFSPSAARSYAGMTALSVDGDVEMPERPERGSVTLEAYVASLVRNLED